MTVRIQHILEYLNTVAPFALAESWDNVGLLLGDAQQPVQKILTALDVTSRVLDEAITTGADTIISHHPFIFRPLATINTGDPYGRLLRLALQNQIALIACHTNLDSAARGVSDSLAAALGLSTCQPLAPAAPSFGDRAGLGRLGHYPLPVPVKEFLHRALTVLRLPALSIAGPLPEAVRTVALCGGSGSDLAPVALARGADLYLSAEIKHSTACWAVEHDFCIIDGSHFGTEQHAVQLLQDLLHQGAAAQRWPVSIACSLSEQAPFTLFDNHVLSAL